MASTTVWLAGVPVAAVGLIVAAVAAGAQEARHPDDILNGSCNTACHDLRPIQTAAMDEKAWNATIDRMIDQGASLADDDRAALIPYLALVHGPMPDGKGKEIVLDICTMCHDLTRVKQTGHTPDEWEDVLETMLNEGAPLSDADFPVVLAYLARNFGPR